MSDYDPLHAYCLVCETAVYDSLGPLGENNPPSLRADCPDGMCFCSTPCAVKWVRQLLAQADEECRMLEEDNRAVNALANAADAVDLKWWRNKPKHPGELRLPCDIFIKIITDALNSNEISHWHTWAETTGVKLLREALQSDAKREST